MAIEKLTPEELADWSTPAPASGYTVTDKHNRLIGFVINAKRGGRWAAYMMGPGLTASELSGLDDPSGVEGAMLIPGDNTWATRREAADAVWDMVKSFRREKHKQAVARAMLT